MAYVPPGGYPLARDQTDGRGVGAGTVVPATYGPTSSNPSATSHGGSLSSIPRLIQGIRSDQTREESLAILAKHRQVYGDLAIVLWDSFGTAASLLKEITSVYHPLLSASLTEKEAVRVSNAIVLLQSVASHPDTRKRFVKAHIPVYLYPFMNTMTRERPYERLRLSSLGVINSLATVDDAEVVDFLLFTQVFPSCLRCMEFGRTLSKTVATLIIYRILLTKEGLKYCFALGERFLVVHRTLEIMVDNLAQEEQEHTPKLLTNIICCYLRLSENERGRHLLSSCIPSKLVDNTYIHILRSYPEALSKLQQLVRNLQPTSLKSRTQSNGESLGTSIR